MNGKDNSWIYVILGIVLMLVAGWGVIYIARSLWDAFTLIDTDLAKALLTAATTVIVAVITITIGRYLERKKEIEARFHQTKVQLYDEFLIELFKVFNFTKKGEAEDTDELVAFLVEWQRKMLLWSSPKTLGKYIEWKKSFGPEPSARNITLLENFILAMRKDLGLSNRRMPNGTLVYMVLKNPELFLELSKIDPNITLAEIAAQETALAGGNES